MCIRDSLKILSGRQVGIVPGALEVVETQLGRGQAGPVAEAVSYTHLRAHETVLDLVCSLLLENKKKHKKKTYNLSICI